MGHHVKKDHNKISAKLKDDFSNGGNTIVTSNNGNKFCPY